MMAGIEKQKPNVSQIEGGVVMIHKRIITLALKSIFMLTLLISGSGFTIASGNLSDSSSAAETYLVEDLIPGIGGSWPEQLTDVNGTLFFAADDGTNGRELWKSDGTMTGTMMIADINPTGGSSPQYLTEAPDPGLQDCQHPPAWVQSFR